MNQEQENKPVTSGFNNWQPDPNVIVTSGYITVIEQPEKPSEEKKKSNEKDNK